MGWFLGARLIEDLSNGAGFGFLAAGSSSSLKQRRLYFPIAFKAYFLDRIKEEGSPEFSVW